MPFTAVRTWTNPQPGDKDVFYGFTWTLTGVEVSIKLTQFQVRCRPNGGPPNTPYKIKVALTKTGNFVPATSWHEVQLTCDSLDYDLGTIDFSTEVSISAIEAASGLIGIIVDWSQAFVNCYVDAGAMTLQVCQQSGGGPAVAAGLGYGSLDGSDEFVGVVSGQVFSEDGDYVPDASAYHWSGNLSHDYVLNDGFWQIWQYQDNEFFTEPNQGVYYRPVSKTFDEQLLPQYEDYANPGRNQGAAAQAAIPPYQVHSFITASDSIASVTNAWAGTPALTYTIDATSNKPTIKVVGGSWSNGYIEFEITLNTATDFSGTVTAANIWSYLMLHFKDTVSLNGTGTGSDALTNIGFTTDITRYQINFANVTGFSAGNMTGYIQAAQLGTVNASTQTDMYAFFDLNAAQAASSAVLAAVKKIRIRVGVRGSGFPSYMRLDEFIQLGVYYHYLPPSQELQNTVTGIPGSTPATDPPVRYAFNYTQTGIVAPATNATELDVASTQALGIQYDPKAPYGGSFIQLTIPKGPAPFGTTAKINIYRWFSGNWYRIYQSADNTDSYATVDTVTDYMILQDPTHATYPIADGGTAANHLPSLVFTQIGPEGSGQVKGIINGCAFGGTNVYFHTNGTAYFSKANGFKVVLWDGISVDLTTIGAADIPRSVQVADDKSPVLVGVPNEPSLYMFTREEGWVIVMQPGQTPATASFPVRIMGSRGVLGVRAADRYLDGAIAGCDDGLWHMVKYDSSSASPQVLQEITRENRGMWAQLIGAEADHATLVVRQLLGDIFCFCQNRWILISKDGYVTYSEWADGGIVTDAKGTPSRGMVVQFSDGSLDVMGPYITDRGTNLAGDNGQAPSWRWRGKRHSVPMQIEKIRAVFENSSGGLSNPAVKVLVNSQRGTTGGDTTNFTDTEDHATRPPGKDSVFPHKIGGAWSEFQVAGSNFDKVTTVEVVITPASAEPSRHQ